MPSASQSFLVDLEEVFLHDTEPGVVLRRSEQSFLTDDTAQIYLQEQEPYAGTAPIEGTANIVLDDMAVTATGSVKNRGAATIVLDDMVVTATGDASPGVVGNADIVLDQLVVSAIGSVKVRGTAAIILDDLAVVAAGHNGADAPPLSNTQMQELYLWMFELRKIHGLHPGVPLMVSTTSRVAGDITQAVAEGGGIVTVTRA